MRSEGLGGLPLWTAATFGSPAFQGMHVMSMPKTQPKQTLQSPTRQQFSAKDMVLLELLPSTADSLQVAPTAARAATEEGNSQQPVASPARKLPKACSAPAHSQPASSSRLPGPGSKPSNTAPLTGTAPTRYWPSAASTQQLHAQRLSKAVPHAALAGSLNVRSAKTNNSACVRITGGSQSAVASTAAAGRSILESAQAAARASSWTDRSTAVLAAGAAEASQASAAHSCSRAASSSSARTGTQSSTIDSYPSHTSDSGSGSSSDCDLDETWRRQDDAAAAVTAAASAALREQQRQLVSRGSTQQAAGRPHRHVRRTASLTDAPASPHGCRTHPAVAPCEGSTSVFWGGVPQRSHRQGNEDLAHVVGNTGRRPSSGHGSRPGTASSYWSNYDLEEGALERALVAASGGQSDQKAPKGRPRSKKEAPLKRSLSGSSSTPRASSAGSTGPLALPRSASVSRQGPRTARSEPWVRVLHPAVIMDPTLLSPCTAPQEQIPVDDKDRPYPYVLPPTFPGAYPTIAFMGSAALMHAAGLHPLMRTRMLVRYAGIANSPVKAAFRDAGWRVTRSAKSRWTVCWGHIFSAEEFAPLHEFQRVNHFPGTWELGRKDYLYRNVAALKRSKGDVLDFIPKFYILPRDYDEFKADLDRHPGRLYIQKPTNSSRGRGVRMVTKPSEISRDVKDLLIQHYVHNPYTINGYKFDMRVYVLASCMDPLRLYVYPDGLARFATEPYSGSKADLKKRCVHLTNYSVNKKNAKFVAPSCTDGLGAQVSGGASGDTGVSVSGDAGSEGVSEGSQSQSQASKWSLHALRQHIEQERGKKAWSRVWQQVHNIVVGAVLSAEPRISTEVKMKVPHRNICFEVWGFDILLDEELRAWLIEVNTCPSLAGDSTLDKRIKTNMVADAMHLVGPVPYDVDEYNACQEARKQARLTGLKASGINAVSGAGGAGASSPPQIPRTVQEVQQLDFRGLACDQLPDIVVETEAEYARRRAWERVFPCPQDPNRYLDWFETPRAASIMLCKYYAQKAGCESLAPGTKLQRPSTTPATPGSSGRPSINTWRPSGMI